MEEINRPVASQHAGSKIDSQLRWASLDGPVVVFSVDAGGTKALVEGTPATLPGEIAGNTSMNSLYGALKQHLIKLSRVQAEAASASGGGAHVVDTTAGWLVNLVGADWVAQNRPAGAPVGKAHFQVNPDAGSKTNTKSICGADAEAKTICVTALCGAEALAATICGQATCGIEAATVSACGIAESVVSVAPVTACGAAVCGADFEIATACAAAACAVAAEAAAACGVAVCKLEAAAASACGAAACGVDATVAHACGTEVCGTDLCATKAGLLSVCGVNTCAGDLGLFPCPVEACAGHLGIPFCPVIL